MQTHRCSKNNYCLKVKKDEAECRFGFPKEIVEKTHVEFEKVKHKDNTDEFETHIAYERNDPHQNTKNPLQLLIARANVDCSITDNPRKTMAYVTKYITEAEPPSVQLKSIFDDQIINNKELTSRNIFSKFMNKIIGERDLSSQEVFHLLMSTDLYSSTETIVNAPLINMRRINKENHDDIPDDSLVNSSILDIYAKRANYENEFPEISKLNYIEFVSSYYVIKKKIRKRKKLAVPKSFPTYSSNPDSNNFPFYCKY